MDLTGLKINRLTVVRKTDLRKHGRIVYECLCVCGQTCMVSSTNIRKGHTKSCGCYKREVDSKRGSENGRRRFNDLKGKRFGRLLVQLKTEKRVNKKVVWKCLCDCGKEAFVMSTQLTTGKTTSCGCYSIDMSKIRFAETISSRSGENHYNYNPSLTEAERLANNSRGNLKGYKTFRKRVLERDDHTCKFCCIRSEKGMRVHHLDSWNLFPEGRFDVNNAVTLCARCHDIQYPGSFHNTFGNGNNTKKQFEEFMKYKILKEV